MHSLPEPTVTKNSKLGGLNNMFIGLTVLEARSPKSRCGQDWFLERDMKENMFMPLSSLLESSAFLPFLYITSLLCMSTSVPKCLTLYNVRQAGTWNLSVQ